MSLKKLDIDDRRIGFLKVIHSLPSVKYVLNIVLRLIHRLITH